jgi:outer membrane lipoprotein-sorting protein
MRKTLPAIVLFLIALGNPSAQELTPEGIMARVDANNTFGTISYTGRMEIDLGSRVIIKEMTAVAEGADKAFVEFLNPEDRGTRYLKIGKDMWIYFPTEQETVKISGHLLKEGMMGSDLSYEDALESGSLTDKYTITLIGQETLDGRSCYVLDLNAKVKTAPYYRQKMWVDAERFVVLKTEMYGKGGKLLKESRALAVESWGSRWFVTGMSVEDKLKKGGGTLFVMTDVRFDVTLPADRFSLRRLER